MPEEQSRTSRGETTAASGDPAAENRGRGHGVRHLEVEEGEAGQRLDKYLVRRLGDVPRTRIFRIIRRGEVRVNGRRVGPEARLSTHDKVRVPPLWGAAKPGATGQEGRAGWPAAREGQWPARPSAVDGGGRRTSDRAGDGSAARAG